MDPDNSVADQQREQRLQAVAKLKRAASLPRMKDGRRPPMHPSEAVSEGEKVNTDDERREDDQDVDTPPPEPATALVIQPTLDDVQDLDPTTDDATTSPSGRSKRRSRSRTRSRGSKDMKLRNRAAISPTASPLVPSDSSQDEAASPLALASPIPNLAALTRARILRSPTPNALEFSPYYPGTRPPTPNLPTLEDLQRGLFRSNSVGSPAVARTMAMHKLTGGTETYDPSPSPTPPPLPGKLGRNNTVSGGEQRKEARQLMLSRLGGRIAKEPTEAETGGSGGEERTAPSPTPKRKRRRSRRGSGAANASANTAGVSDSEFISTSPNTPIVPQTPLPGSFDGFPEPRLPTPLSRAVTPHSPSEEDLPPLPSTSARASPAPVRSLRQSPVEPEQQQPRRRSVVVEDEDDEQRLPLPLKRLPTPPQLPQLNYDYSKHSPNLFNDLFPDIARASSVRASPVRASPVRVASPPALTAHSSRHPTPEYPIRSSPFNVPLQEKQSQEEEEEEEVLYPGDSYPLRNTYDDEFDRQISWIASPVPEIRMPIDDDEREEDDVVDEEEEEDYEHRPSPRSSAEFSPPEAYDDTSPRNSYESKGIVVESETSPEIVPSQVPPSPSSVTALSQSLSQPTSMVRTASDDSTSPQQYPTGLSMTSRTQDRSPLMPEFDWDDVNKRNWDSGSISTWDKIKGTFRSGSAAGRRSRTNSIVTRERRDNTDSSVSRESGASLGSGKTDKVDVATPLVNQTPLGVMQSGSASASAASLSQNASPFPTPSSTDLLKYQNVAKLFPFPGMKKLEEQRNRTKGMLTPSASTPDISTLFNGYDTDGGAPQATSSNTNTPMQSPEPRDRKLSHQASDTRLLDKYAQATSPPNSAAADIGYFNVPSPISPSTSTGSKLPMTLPGVKQWLNSRKKSSAANTPTSELGKLSPNPSKKPSLSDLILRKENGLGREWEDGEIIPLSASESMFGKSAESRAMTPSPLPYAVPLTAPPSQSSFSQNTFSVSDTERTPKAKRVIASPPPVDVDETSYLMMDPPNPLPSPPDPLSATPDPSSSLSDYPAPSTSESSSTTSSHYSFGALRGDSGTQASFVLERLEENLSRGSRSPMWASAIDDPPRKLLLSSPVLQVVNANTVKDRFLFLFSDILVIAKALPDQDTGSDNRKIASQDRKFVVKSVVLLSQLRFNAERTDIQPKLGNYSTAPRNPMIRTFVYQFSKDMDHAITSLLSKSSTSDDALTLGQLLFKTLDLDRAKLGDYLSRRTSKVVLKAYVDSFRFVGIRVDKALRTFLLSLNVPSKMVYSNASALDYLLDAFAGRWYEANARIVAFDKDLANRLVKAIVQLNEYLHGGIAQEPGPTGFRSIASREFVDAFRRLDARYLVSDGLLEEIFESVRKERLSQARITSSGPPDIQIMIKRPLPTRLTYKVQSDPIILRIQQADPDLTIQLFGQDLVFDPPYLTFARSSEASFRVTGTSLGSKTMIMCRSGPNALKYSGLPLGHSLVVERSFMRNTFEMAFLNHCGLKRRYMFSVDDPLIRHQWVVSLNRQIDRALATPSSTLSGTSPGASKFHRAAETVAFKVLQQTLIGSDGLPDSSPGPLSSALQDLGSISSPRLNGNGGFRFPADRLATEKDARISAHVRSKSRSQMYLRGAGRNELDLNNEGEFPTDDSYDPDLSLRIDGPVWSGRDIEMQCQQNSSIPLVLAFLQVGSPDHGQN